MKKLPKGFKALALAIIIGGISISTIVFADDIGIIKVSNKAIAVDVNNVSKMDSKTISDIHKIWTIKFNSSIDVDSFVNSIQVKDLTEGKIQQVSVAIGEDGNSIKINPPEQGYKVDHDYEILINNDIKSKKGKKLDKAGAMNFKVVDINKANYTASAKVVVSPVLPILKQITINSLNMPDIKTVKVTGSDKVFQIGETIASATSGNTITLYFYSSDGKTIVAKGEVDVSQSKDNFTIKLVNEK